MNPPTDATARLLIPVSAEQADLQAIIRYAIGRHSPASPLEVVLLHVAPVITQWEVLRFRTQQEIAEFQAERAQRFLDDAAAQLAAAGVTSHRVFRRGDVAFTILDVAEEQQCSEIVMPEQPRGLGRLFSTGWTRRVIKGQRQVPVRQVGNA